MLDYGSEEALQLEIPKRIWPPIFVEYFRYGGHHIPGSASLPVHWTAVSGSFSTANEHHLLCTSPGILRYNGTPIDELTNSINLNYAWVVRFYGQKGLHFRLRVREDVAADQYVGA